MLTAEPGCDVRNGARTPAPWRGVTRVSAGVTWAVMIHQPVAHAVRHVRQADR